MAASPIADDAYSHAFGNGDGRRGIGTLKGHGRPARPVLMRRKAAQVGMHRAPDLQAAGVDFLTNRCPDGGQPDRGRCVFARLWQRQRPPADRGIVTLKGHGRDRRVLSLLRRKAAQGRRLHKACRIRRYLHRWGPRRSLPLTLLHLPAGAGSARRCRVARTPLRGVVRSFGKGSSATHIRAAQVGMAYVRSATGPKITPDIPGRALCLPRHHRMSCVQPDARGVRRGRVFLQVGAGRRNTGLAWLYSRRDLT